MPGAASMQMMAAYGGGTPLTSIAFLTSETTINASITCPTVKAFDVGVLFDWGSASGSAPALNIPSGFTLLRSDASSSWRGAVSYRVFDGTEGGASLSGLSASSAMKVLLVFRPDGPIYTVTASSWLGAITDANPSSQTIAASGQLAPLIRLAAGASSAFGVPPFTSGTFDATVSNTSLNTGYAIQNSSPTNDNVDIGDGGNNNWLASGFITVS